MTPQISSLSFSRHFSFEGTDCLYRGFDGERVVADCEGEGEVYLCRAESPLTIVRDGEPTEVFPSVFRDSFTISAAGPGRVASHLLSHVPDVSLLGEPQEFYNEYSGAGWVVGGEGKWQLDDRNEWVEPKGPAPIFRSAKGKGRLQVVADTRTRCILADAWDVDDADALKQRGWTVQNMSKLRPLDSRFADGSSRNAMVASHLNAGHWTSPIPPDNMGIVLRRYYDRFHGRQRARIHVDGETVGVWYEPREDRIQRWAVSDFGIPATCTVGKSSLRLTVDPPSGVSLWSVSRMEVWALKST